MTDTPEIPFEKYELGGAYHWKWYMVDFEGYRGFVDSLVKLFPLPGRILDVGCGDGLISYMLFRRGFEVVGIDTSEFGLRLASDTCQRAVLGAFDDALAIDHAGPHLMQRFKDGELEFRRQSIKDFNETETFDYVLCSEVIEHVPAPERLVANVQRAMRDFAVITTPDGRLDGPGPSDYQVWTPDEFQTFLTGYRIEPFAIREGTISVRLFKT